MKHSVNTNQFNTKGYKFSDQVVLYELCFRTIFENISECILVWDRNYNYIYANPAAIKHVNTTPENVIGKNIRDGLGHIPEFMHLWMERIDKVFATDTLLDVEDRMPVGEHTVFSKSELIPIHSPDDELFAVGVVYRDVSSEKRIEQSLRQRTFDLHERIKEMKCLYNIIALAETPGISLAEILGESVELIPHGFECPEDTSVHLRYFDSIYRSKKFLKSGQKIYAELFVNNQEVGHIALYCPDTTEGNREKCSFLNEKEYLLYGVANVIGRIIENRVALQDISAMKERYETLVRNLPEAIYSIQLNVHGKFLFLSERWVEWTGYSLEKFYEQGRQLFLRCVHPKDKERVIAVFNQTLKDKINYICEYRIVHKETNQIRYVLDHGAPIKDDNDNLISIDGVVTDITERKMMEDSLLESEERFRVLTDAVSSIIWTTNGKGEIIVPQPAWENYTGQPWDEYRNFGWLTQVHPEDQERIRSIAYKGIDNKKGYVVEERIWSQAHKNYRYVETRTVPLFDEEGNIKEWVGTTNDIHEQTVAEQLIQESEDRFRSTFEQAAIGLVHAEMSGQFIRVNQRFCEIVGYSEKEILQKKFLDITHPLDKARDEEELKLLIEDSIKSFSMEKRFIKKDGAIVWVNLTGSCMRDSEHKVIYLIGAIEDITVRREMEEKLILKSEELSRSNEELEKFAYISSHDLQEPLRKIMTFSDRLSQKYSSQLEERGKEYITRMRLSAERMQKLINDLLAYSRVSLTEELFEQVNLNHVIEDLLDDLAMEIEVSEAEIEVGELMVIHAESVQMNVLFKNLISNAIKFSSKEAKPFIKITGKLCKRMSPKGNKEVDFYQVSIQDNGIGIDPHYIDRIFTIFQRLHSKEAYDGTGIGLAICQKIVERHRGFIQVESQLGQGSVFHVFLPLS